VSWILSAPSCHILPSPPKTQAQDERWGGERAGERARSPSKGGTQPISQTAAIGAGMNTKHNLLPVRSHFAASGFLKMQGGDARNRALPVNASPTHSCTQQHHTREMAGGESAGGTKHRSTLAATKPDPKNCNLPGPAEVQKHHTISIS